MEPVRAIFSYYKPEYILSELADVLQSKGNPFSFSKDFFKINFTYRPYGYEEESNMGGSSMTDGVNVKVVFYMYKEAPKYDQYDDDDDDDDEGEEPERDVICVSF